MIKLKTPLYLMATTAIHQTGDISRAQTDLCQVHSEDADNYIGNWVTGFGFINVKFPKASTRRLTAEEQTYYHGRLMSTPGGVYALNLTGEAFDHQVVLTKVEGQGNWPSRTGMLIAPIKEGAPIALQKTEGGTYITTPAVSVLPYADGTKDKVLEVYTKNSRYRVRYVRQAQAAQNESP